jgi:tetrahydromethanopterin S-methyltransferase subunit D
MLILIEVAISAIGASIGGYGGALCLRVNEKVLRIAVAAIGVLLTIGLFLRAA